MALNPALSIRQGLVAYWPLAGAAAVDLKSGLSDGGGPYDLTDGNTVTRAAGPGANLPNAASFASVTSESLTRAVAASPSLVRGGKGSFEINGWVFVADTAAASRTIISQYETTSNQRAWWAFFGSGGTTITWRTSVDGTNNVDTTVGVAGASTWAFMTVYFDSRGVQGGMLNMRTATETAQTGIFASTGAFAFGSRGSGADYFNGRLAHFSLHERLLTSAERFWLYNNGAGRDLTRGA